MSLPSGTRLGPYEVLAPLGAGGMGEVYRGRDTRLDRAVAIKVLPPHLSESRELRERFEREARAISSLSHPHICTLYDVGQHDGLAYLVMEYLQGETLADRVLKGLLPLDQALRYAIEIADALDKAHRQGVIHRDLKPGNVMLTRSGAKLLDFGLAKLQPALRGPAAAALSELETQERPLTDQGAILGTFQYMAPEQLEGREADARTDIFAFGVVLYEMVTGRRAFDGKSAASLIGAILRDEPPPMSTLQPMVPAALDRVVRACLAKDTDERWQNAHDLLSELQWIAEQGGQHGVPAHRRAGERLAWVVAAASALVALVLAGALARNRPEPAATVVASIMPPENAQFAFDIEQGAMALSPDGRRMAFVAVAADGRQLLWIRDLDRASARPLAGTDGAGHPFWSPDGRWVGFFAGGKLKKVEAAGGAPQTLCDAPVGRGGAWNRRGVILFAPGFWTPLHRVDAAGGPPETVTRLESVASHRWPAFLPDDRHFIFLGWNPGDTSGSLYVSDLESRTQRLLMEVSSSAAYAPPGYLLFWRERALRSQPFDARRLALAGEPVAVVDSVRYFPNTARAIFSVSENGLLAYDPGVVTALSQLTWFDRGGKVLGTVGRPAEITSPRLSHDGRRLLVSALDPQASAFSSDLWMYELDRGVGTRFTFDPRNEQRAAWSPDDGQVAFTITRDLYLKRSSGAAAAQPLLTSVDAIKQPTDWSADGRLIVLQVLDTRAKTNWDVWVYSVEEKKATPVIQGPFTDTLGQLSPDGRWLAYVSSEAGRSEVYVQPFPGSGGKWQVSTAGGTQPRWRRDGRELFYRAPDGRFVAVAVKTGPDSFEVSAPQPLFATRMKTGVFFEYDVSADGQRFLVNVPVQDESFMPITLVANWTALLQR